MKGNQPTFTLVMPKTAEQERTYIGAEWKTANESVFSCRITLPFDVKAGEQISFIRVPFEPKETQSASEPAPQPEPAPVRSAPRQRKAQGEQPRGAA